MNTNWVIASRGMYKVSLDLPSFARYARSLSLWSNFIIYLPILYSWKHQNYSAHPSHPSSPLRRLSLAVFTSSSTLLDSEITFYLFFFNFFKIVFFYPFFLSIFLNNFSRKWLLFQNNYFEWVFLLKPPHPFLTPSSLPPHPLLTPSSVLKIRWCPLLTPQNKVVSPPHLFLIPSHSLLIPPQPSSFYFQFLLIHNIYFISLFYYNPLLFLSESSEIGWIKDFCLSFLYHLI